ncbi:zf-HC2 domain-containing protein [Paractinoplanes lichenicola]|uniref:Zf-HC2 domain-containing protein n=1 Tax=Paractinoplanes lichenicola TaxID=2802976 RepID=A0ABS1W159_9ACTN|nr:zf-HC2 domain-containing protein [Actinoplanes lichenicola]MBL7260477.1 zf-HC2 domain-containing protein [Actinoplanes lichenicola]
MNGHQTEQLGAYALGVLDDDEWAAVHAHVEDCPQCRREVGDLREMEERLGEIPPEAFLEGPPPDGELLLHKTLRQVRDEGRGHDRRRGALWTLAGVAAAVIALAGGLYAGRTTAPETDAQTVAAASAAAPRVLTALDKTTGTAVNVTMTPAAGWVRLSATVAGVPAGSQCRLFVVASDGRREFAGSWLVSEAGASEGTTVDGSALVAPADVAAVQVETYAGQVLATATI